MPGRTTATHNVWSIHAHLLNYERKREKERYASKHQTNGNSENAEQEDHASSLTSFAVEAFLLPCY